MVLLDPEKESYFSRNGKWLTPLIASFILITLPLLMNVFVAGQGAQGIQVPPWLGMVAVVGGGVGVTLTLIWVFVTETLSAKAISSVLTALGYAILISEFIDWLGR